VAGDGEVGLAAVEDEVEKQAWSVREPLSSRMRWHWDAPRAPSIFMASFRAASMFT
jgi:hypothetical protein